MTSNMVDEKALEEARKAVAHYRGADLNRAFIEAYEAAKQPLEEVSEAEEAEVFRSFYSDLWLFGAHAARKALRAAGYRIVKGGA